MDICRMVLLIPKQVYYPIYLPDDYCQIPKINFQKFTIVSFLGKHRKINYNKNETIKTFRVLN